MNIDYMTGDAKISEKELSLLQQAKSDIENDQLTTYTSHRDILGR